MVFKNALKVWLSGKGLGVVMRGFQVQPFRFQKEPKKVKEIVFCFFGCQTCLFFFSVLEDKKLI